MGGNLIGKDSPAYLYLVDETRGATTAEKLRGPRFGSQHRGACARPKAGLGVGGGMGSPPPAVRARGYHPRNFFKTQMLNPAFW